MTNERETERSKRAGIADSIVDNNRRKERERETGVPSRLEDSSLSLSIYLYLSRVLLLLLLLLRGNFSVKEKTRLLLLTARTNRVSFDARVVPRIRERTYNEQPRSLGEIKLYASVSIRAFFKPAHKITLPEMDSSLSLSLYFPRKEAA